MAIVKKTSYVARLLMALGALLLITSPVVLRADDCKRVPNILVLFDGSGYMKEKNRYDLLLEQMRHFEKAIPLTADGFFNVGLRHYGLKVGLGCENTESILGVGPWDPERFINAFPAHVSYGVSSLSAGLRAAADELAGLNGKSVIVVVGQGVESCQTDPVKIAQQIAANNPDLEIHTFQIGGSQDGRFFLENIAKKGRGTYHNAGEFRSPAEWHSWMRQYLLTPCARPAQAEAAAPVTPQGPMMVTFDNNSFTVRSSDPAADAQNQAALNQVAQVLARNAAARVVLHGFSDGKGKPEYNLMLSRKRAEAVARHLITAYRLPGTRVGIVAHGMAGAISPQGPARDDRFGRRVEFEIVQ